MTFETEQLERVAEEARRRLLATLDELRTRATPGAVIDQLIVYARRGAPAEFFRNLAREVQENPVPVVLIGISVAWLAISASRSSRMAIASAADTVSRKASEIGTATGAAIGRTGEAAARAADRVGVTVGKRTADLAARTRDAADTVSRKAAELGAATSAVAARTSEAAARLAERIGEAGDAAGTRTSELAARTRDAAGGVAERAQEASALTAAALGKEGWPLAGASERSTVPANPARDNRRPAAAGEATGDKP